MDNILESNVLLVPNVLNKVQIRKEVLLLLHSQAFNTLQMIALIFMINFYVFWICFVYQLQ